MPKTLRSNFPYGSYLWAVRAAQWRALGIDESELEKPKIAIVNSSSNLAICFSHLDGIAAKIKQSIRDAGALPFEIRTAAPSDFITGAGAGGAYMLAARDLITNDIEVAVEGAQLDGMICLASCDKTVPGQLMAAARLNIPTLIVVCGYQPSGEYNGQHVDIEDVFISSMHVVTGKLPVEELVGMARNAIKGPGVCSGMGTANSMHLVCEALGMALPGSSPIAANSPQMFDFVHQAGRRIVEMVEEDLKPRDILTPGAFANAVATILAAGGSVNTIKHMQAVAAEGGIDVDVYQLFRELGKQVPVLVGVRPVGEHSIEQMEAAGGGRGLLKRLEPLLHGDVLTVTGKTLRQNLEGGHHQRRRGDPPAGQAFRHPAGDRDAARQYRAPGRHHQIRHRPEQDAPVQGPRDLFRTLRRRHRSVAGRAHKTRTRGGHARCRCTRWPGHGRRRFESRVRH